MVLASHVTDLEHFEEAQHLLALVYTPVIS